MQTQSAQQGKDISKITTDIHGVSVDLANLNGDVNQTKVTVQGLQSTLGNAQGDIAQIKVDAKRLETSLSGKVDNSTYANFVSATNNALNAKLVASDLNGYAKTTDLQATANGLQVNINSVADRMNNLKIGAENLLTNTGDLKDYQTNNYGQIQDIVKSNYIPLILNHPELTHMGHIWTDWQSVYSNQEVILEKDKPYWFGFYVCTDRSDGNPFGKINILGVKKESDLSHSKVFVEQNIENYSYFGGAAKHWVWHTYKIIGDDEIYSGIRVEGNKSTGGSAYIAGYTLVQSDVAPTGHISSLEDTKHELSQLSAQITANNQKFSSYYTKVETDSKANTAKNDAISAIKNDGNWHGLTNILTNSGFLQTSDGFTQKVQQTTQPMINSANSGGVNLLVNTYNFGGFTSEQKGKWTVDPKSNYSNNAGFALIKTMVAHVYGDSWNNSKLNINQTIYLPAGKYIFSFLASVNSQQNNSFSLQLTANINGVNKVLNGNSGIITYSWQTHTMEFVLTENSTISNIQLYNSSNSGLPGESIYFANLKLESGSLATTWCPAPEDYATQTSFSELNQTVNGLQSTVSGNYGDLQTRISQTDSAIREELSNQITGVTNQITTTASGLTARIDNIRVGGRNLLHGASDQYRTLTYKQQYYATTASDMWTSTAEYHNGDQFTYSATITNTSEVPVRLALYCYDNDKKTVLKKAVGPTVGPNSGSIPTYVSITMDYQTWFLCSDIETLDGEASTFSIQVKDEQLEEGNVRTAWTTNPDDIASQFTEVNATINGLQSTVSGNYGALQTQISQTAAAIRSELSDQISGVTNQITTTASGLNARISAIQIGGRNLLHNTSNQYRTLTGAGWLYQTTASDMWTSTAEYHNGDQFTYSATITNTSEVPVRLALYCYDNDKKTVLKKAVGPTVGPNSGSIPTYVSITMDYQTWFLCSDIETLDGEASTFSIQVKDEQLEEGNVRTAWTTNPDDIASQFTEVNATINGLQSTVGSNYSALQSQINQTATTIRGEVTNSVSGLQTQITQQDNNFNVSLNSLRKETAWQKVTTAIDANNYTTTGNYWIQAVPNSNTPDGSAWAYLQVVAYPDVKRIKQTWQRDNNENEIYTRLLIGDNWTSWQRTVTGGNIMAQINMSAGTTLIQNDKIYMDASSTVFSGKAFIPDAAITNISADKINTGTLDAGRINVINLNANNITTGTINGANLKINLNSGEILFQKGRIGSTNGYLNIDIDSGKMSVTDYWHDGFYFEDGKLYLSDNFALKTNWEPKYGVIRRSLNPFTVGESGIEIASPTGVSLQTMNYDGSFGGGDLGDQTKNGASVAIDKNGQALINGKQVGLVGGTFFDTDQNFLQRRPRIVVGTDAANSGLLPWGWGDPLNHVASRIVIDASYVHFPHSYKTTTGSAPNVFIASDGALVRSTSASKYKTEIKRSYSTEYGEKLLNLPTAIWTDKGQKERYKAGKRHIKPEKYFGMIAEDLADAGLDLLVSRNPLTHEIEGIQYERIAPALLPVIKKLKDKVNRLEKQINER